MKKNSLVNLLVLLVALCLATGPLFAQAKSTSKKAAPAASAGQAENKAGKSATPVDINSATKQQLMTLTGIGDAYSQKIIDNRPYKAKNELVQKKILPEGVYDKISGQIIAKQGSSGAAKKSEAPNKK